MRSTAGRLAGKVAIVTGGGHGIGKAYALGLAREGAKLVVAEIDASAAEAVAADLKRQGFDAIAVHPPTRGPRERRGRWPGARVEGVQANRHPGSTTPRSSPPCRCRARLSTRSRSRMGPHDGGQPARHVGSLRAPSCRTCGRAATARSQHQLGHGPEGLGEPHPLRHFEGGRCWASRAPSRKELGQHGICVNLRRSGEHALGGESERRASSRCAQAAARTARSSACRTEDLVGADRFFASPESDFITGQTLVVDGGACMH